MYYVWDRVEKKIVQDSESVKKVDIIKYRDHLNDRVGRKR